MRAADGKHSALLDNAEELGLRFATHLADFIEEKRSAVRSLDESWVSPVGSGERTLLMPEQLALDQGLDDGGAIDRHERTRSTGSLVDGLGCFFFAGAGFTSDENGNSCRSDALDRFHDSAHRNRLANHDEPQQTCGFLTPPPPPQPLTNSPSNLNESISS